MPHAKGKAIPAPGIPRWRAFCYPDVALAIEIEAVGPGEQPGSNALDDPPLAIELMNGRKVRAGTLIRATAFYYPHMLAIGVRVNTRHNTHCSSIGELTPVIDDLIGIAGDSLGMGIARSHDYRYHARYDEKTGINTGKK